MNKDTRSEYIANAQQQTYSKPYFMQRKPAFSLFGFLWNVTCWLSVLLVIVLFVESFIRNS